MNMFCKYYYMEITELLFKNDPLKQKQEISVHAHFVTKFYPFKKKKTTTSDACT